MYKWLPVCEELSVGDVEHDVAELAVAAQRRQLAEDGARVLLRRVRQPRPAAAAPAPRRPALAHPAHTHTLHPTPPQTDMQQQANSPHPHHKRSTTLHFARLVGKANTKST